MVGELWIFRNINVGYFSIAAEFGLHNSAGRFEATMGRGGRQCGEEEQGQREGGRERMM